MRTPVEKNMKIVQRKNLLVVIRQTNWGVSGKDRASELSDIRLTMLTYCIKFFEFSKASRN